jgi:hypothetical protein
MIAGKGASLKTKCRKKGREDKFTNASDAK